MRFPLVLAFDRRQERASYHAGVDATGRGLVG